MTPGAAAEQTCGTCCWRKVGSCRINPPVLLGPGGEGEWPPVGQAEPACSKWHRISTGSERRTPDERRGEPR